MVNLHEDVAVRLQALPVTNRHFGPSGIVWSEYDGNRRRHVGQLSFSPAKFKLALTGASWACPIENMCVSLARIGLEAAHCGPPPTDAPLAAHVRPSVLTLLV
jgi:hypothetical protein